MQESAAVLQRLAPKRAPLIGLVAITVFINCIDRGNLATAAPLIRSTMFGPAFGMLAGGLILAALGWRAMFFLFGAVAMQWPLRPTSRRTSLLLKT